MEETLDIDWSLKLSSITLTRGVPNMIINKTLIFQTGGATSKRNLPLEVCKRTAPPVWKQEEKKD